MSHIGVLMMKQIQGSPWSVRSISFRHKANWSQVQAPLVPDKLQHELAYPVGLWALRFGMLADVAPVDFYHSTKAGARAWSKKMYTKEEAQRSCGWIRFRDVTPSLLETLHSATTSATSFANDSGSWFLPLSYFQHFSQFLFDAW